MQFRLSLRVVSCKLHIICMNRRKYYDVNSCLTIYCLEIRENQQKVLHAGRYLKKSSTPMK